MHTSPFTVDTTTTHQRDQVHCDLSTATIWTIHLRVDWPLTVEQIVEAVRKTGCEYLTGEWIGGDSFREWCEEYETTPNVYEDGFDRAHYSRSMGRALHVDIVADDREQAVQRTVDLMAEVYTRHDALECYRVNTHVALSTGGDWAEQAPLPSLRITTRTLNEVAYVSRHPSLGDCMNGKCQTCQDGE